MDIRSLKKLVHLQDEYLNLLTDELNEVVGLATVHGWKSTRVEEGKRLREDIKSLRDKG